jgi:hypothetical protein
MRTASFVCLFFPALAYHNLLATAWVHVRATSSPRQHDSQLNAFQNAVEDADDKVGRRTFLQSAALLSSMLPFSATPASAASPADTLMSREKIASLLRAIPTFTIVDAKGVPFMVVGEDAKVTGYFFTEFEEANRLLKLARSSVDKAIQQELREEAEQRNNPATTEDTTRATMTVNPWNDARISTVPLDFAVTFVTRVRSPSSSGNNYFQVAPSVQDIDDALAVTGKTELAEGKVPLFYFENFKLAADGTTPLYFRKSELEAAYRAQYPQSSSLPKLSVTELFAVLVQMATSQNEDLKTLVFVPLKNSAQKALQCKSDVPFLLGERNIVL